MMLSRYKETLLNGRIGSVFDFSWDRTKKIHTCCESKTWWRHKATCLQVIGKDEEIGNQKWKDLDKMDKAEYIKKVFAT